MVNFKILCVAMSVAILSPLTSAEVIYNLGDNLEGQKVVYKYLKQTRIKQVDPAITDLHRGAFGPVGYLLNDAIASHFQYLAGPSQPPAFVMDRKPALLVAGNPTSEYSAQNALGNKNVFKRERAEQALKDKLNELASIDYMSALKDKRFFIDGETIQGNQKFNITEMSKAFTLKRFNSQLTFICDSDSDAYGVFLAASINVSGMANDLKLDNPLRDKKIDAQWALGNKPIFIRLASEITESMSADSDGTCRYTYQFGEDLAKAERYEDILSNYPVKPVLQGSFSARTESGSVVLNVDQIDLYYQHKGQWNLLDSLQGQTFTQTDFLQSAVRNRLNENGDLSTGFLLDKDKMGRFMSGEFSYALGPEADKRFMRVKPDGKYNKDGQIELHVYSNDGSGDYFVYRGHRGDDEVYEFALVQIRHTKQSINDIPMHLLMYLSTEFTSYRPAVLEYTVNNILNKDPKKAIMLNLTEDVIFDFK